MFAAGERLDSRPLDPSGDDLDDLALSLDGTLDGLLHLHVHLQRWRQLSGLQHTENVGTGDEDWTIREILIRPGHRRPRSCKSWQLDSLESLKDGSRLFQEVLFFPVLTGWWGRAGFNLRVVVSVAI